VGVKVRNRIEANRGQEEESNGAGTVGGDAVRWKVCESAVEVAALESVVDRAIPGSVVVGGGVGLLGRATEVVDVEGNTRRETTGNTSARDIKGGVADRAVGAVGSEVDKETEATNGGEADDGVRRDVGAEGEGEDDWPSVVAWLSVGTVVADH
jgi:hypothetical protein